MSITSTPSRTDLPGNRRALRVDFEVDPANRSGPDGTASVRGSITAARTP
jgi:hypothetical protein